MTVALLLAATLSQPTPTVADVSWIAGCWTIASPGRTVTEFWLPPAGGTMMGISRTVVNDRTTEYEFIVLRAGAAGLEYVAKPSRQAEAVFTATTVSGTEVVFENPTHDFPTRIRYRLADGGLVATIYGNLNGKPRAIDFKFQRGDCLR
jgi:hypothetical protein